MNIQQLINAAESIANGVGIDPHQSAIIDSDMTAEDLLPHAFRYAYNQLLNSGEMRFQDVMVAHAIPVVTGVGTLPVGVLTAHLDQAFLPEYPYSAFMRYLSDYQRQRYAALLCYWTVDNGKFYTSCALDVSKNVILHAPSIPVIPNDIVTNVTMSATAENAVIMTLAQALRGDLKLVS